MPNKPDEFIPTRRSLLERLKDLDDEASWHDFYKCYRKLIFSTAIKAGVREQEAEDVVQETVITVAKTMPEYRYDPAVCSFKSWLMRLARFRIIDHLRKRPRADEFESPEVEDSAATPTLDRLPDPAEPALETIWDEEWKNDLMEKATQRVKTRVRAEQYQMFDFYVLRKWPVGKVAKDLGVSVGQVYLNKHRVAKLIKEEIATIEKELSERRWPIVPRR